jgi:tetratricopeptide (TPR) repeat protein
MTSKRFIYLIGVSLVAACFAQAQDSTAARKAAASALSSRQYNQALRDLEPLLKQHPRDPILLTMRGVALDGLDRTTESLSSFDRALAIDPTFLPALKGAAQVSYLRANPRALEYIKKLLAVMPANDVGNAMAGALSYQAHDCTAVISYFTLSNDQVYRDPKALDEFADCLLKQGQNDDALRVLLRGTQLHPDRADLTYNLAVAQLRTHQPAEAIKTLTPLSNSNDADLLNLLASAYVQTNQPDDAFRALEKAIELNPTDQTNYLDLAILCLEHNQENRSVKAATAGIARIPNAASLYLIRGVAYAQLAQYDQAEKDFVAAAQLEPDQPHSVVAMSMLYSDRNQPDKEKALLTKQLAITPNDSVTNYLLADLIIRAGVQPGQPAFQEAKGYLATSLATKPDSAEAQILMGHLLEQENNISDAVGHYGKAIELEPDNRSALDRQFILLRRLHRNDEAAQTLQHLKSVLNNEIEQERKSFPVRTSAAPQSQP